MGTLYSALATLFVLAASQALAQEGPEVLAGHINRVRDGDTLIVSGLPVRLEGVDAPERDTAAGKEASLWMRRATHGKEATCLLTGERTYDRVVGVCYVELDGLEQDIGAAIIAAGHALDCRRHSGGRYRDLEPTNARYRIKPAPHCG
ncbi:MAG: nuclease [Rhodovulum sulfidophilum]|uniref:Nuclease n=1 Tax=Rhodovulum sulfidophilum TaxID=35806 RepID=A0A2W5N8C2_RHOSU|nr:MAG: nuclease [Rhodovulum sulfidophilum]